MNLTFLQYNNYYNRIIKKENSLTDYQTEAETYYTCSNINFNPNDSVNTEQIVNWNQSWNPDYLVCWDNTNVIDSRWFVIESQRTRNGQYKMTLHRDLIADNMEQVLGATMFIEKATIQTSEDVAIYNRENLEVNSIKTDEILLKDKTKVPWIVGYFSKATPDTDVEIESTEIDAITVNTFSSWDFKDYVTTDYKYVTNYELEARFTLQPQFVINGACRVTTSGNYEVLKNTLNGYAGRYNNVTKGKDAREAFAAGLANYFRANKNLIEGHLEDEYNYKFTDSISKLNGKYVYFQNASTGYPAGYYKITVSSSTATDEGWYNRGTESEIYFNTQLFANYNNNFHYIFPLAQDDPDRNIYRSIKYTKYRITLTSVTAGKLAVTIPSSCRKLTDAPYSMFCIPADSTFVLSGQSTSFTSLTRQEAINAATTIATTLGDNLYDLQLLPYCPMIKGVDENGIDTTLLEEEEYTYIETDHNVKKGIVLFASRSKFNFEIEKSLSYPSTIMDLKVANQADSYRLCSPNYSASFEFNIVKTGPLSKFDIDCTYRPFTPYIHVVPEWSKLYGRDYDDARGLICQGEFSLPVMNNNWIDYQLNNKNYLNAFNRQIDSIELRNKWALANDITGAAAGTVQGAMMGAKVGGGWGAAIGGAVSAAAGVADIAQGVSLRNDALDLTKDQFNFDLQNIQAQPQTIAKVSSYDINNKIFPFLEYYTCTDEEKDILKDKMNYNGMTIMRIGNIAEFLDGAGKHYVKGQLIRCEDLTDDFHMLTAIADELYKGVYI